MGRFDAYGPYATFARAAVGLTVVAVLSFVGGVVLVSPLPRTLTVGAMVGLLLTGTGGGLLVGAAVMVLAAGRAIERDETIGAESAKSDGGDEEA